MGALRAAARGRGTKLRRRSFLPCVRGATRDGFRLRQGKCACQSARRRIILADKGAGRASGGILTSKRIGHGTPVRLCFAPRSLKRQSRRAFDGDLGETMNPDISNSRARRSARLALLFGTASLSALAGSEANAAAAAAAPVEEVLITGSLISGTAAIGVPVTNLGADDFREVAPLSVYQIIQTLPAIESRTSDSPSVGGTRHFQGNISIHGQDSQEQLLMIDGKRYPLQGYDLDNIDPSFIPQLAVQRVDVLTAGASATYGADAIAGVINIILKRGFDGA